MKCIFSITIFITIRDRKKMAKQIENPLLLCKTSESCISNEKGITFDQYKERMESSFASIGYEETFDDAYAWLEVKEIIECTNGIIKKGFYADAQIAAYIFNGESIEESEPDEQPITLDDFIDLSGPPVEYLPSKGIFERTIKAINKLDGVYKSDSALPKLIDLMPDSDPANIKFALTNIIKKPRYSRQVFARELQPKVGGGDPFVAYGPLSERGVVA